MNKPNETLSATFIALEKQQAKSDGIAGGILEAIRAARATKVDKFDAMVHAAYDENGWNYKTGRPVVGAEIKRVPHIIRVYVSTIRTAYLVGLHVTEFDSMYQLREAIAAKRSAKTATSPARPPAYDDGLQGVRLLKPEELIGEPVHDLAVVYVHLPEDQRELLARGVDRLVKKYAPMVEGSIAA